MSSVRVVPVAAWGALDALEPTARAIFGEGQRQPGWFRRKLDRECVDASLSRVALDLVGTPVGYVLVGRPPQLAPSARTAGTGVVPSMRGTGIGSRLIRSVLDGCAAAGCDLLRLPATLHRVDFYRASGFTLSHEIWTLSLPSSEPVPKFDPPPQLAPRIALNLSSSPPRAWQAGVRRPIAWLEDAWERTPCHERETLDLRAKDVHLTLHVSREGRARLMHALEQHAGSDDAAGTALTRFARQTANRGPLLLPALDPRTSWTRSLLDRGWIPVQKGAQMEWRRL